MQARIFLLFIVVFIAGCTSSEVKEEKALTEIKEKEAPFKDRDHKSDQKEVRDMIAAYEDFAQKFPKSKDAPEMLYRASKSYLSLNEFEAAVSIYQRLRDEYPEYNKEDVLFWQAYIYEEKLHRLDKAKELYEKFLQLYPNHDLADDVKFALENLGKSPEQIIIEKGWDKPENTVTDSSSGS